MGLREKARDELCTIRLPGCTGGGPDTVLAHYGGLRFGGGTGYKADDLAGAHACAFCHDVVDGRKRRPDWMTKVDVRLAHAEGCMETIIRLRSRDAIKVL